jgi:hypothetical protein
MFLRKEQGVLIEKLKRRSPEIADMYYGGLCSFADERNPFRLSLAEYFKLVAHGKHKTNPEEFVNRLFLVDDILLRRLQPRPVSDLDEIDSLLAEAD